MSLVLKNENGDIRNRYSLYKTIVFDAQMDGRSYHLAEGNWYEVSREYTEKLSVALDNLFIDSELPAFSHDTEGLYNKAVAADIAEYGCLDTKNISPAGQTQIEPCDLIRLKEDAVDLCHVKVSTRSSSLSHLFNQAANSLEILRAEPDSREKLKALLDGIEVDGKEAIKAAVDAGRFKVSIAIITKKDPELLSAALPLFSRISLMRAMRSIEVMTAGRSVEFVKDDKPAKPATKPKNKSKAEDGGGEF